MNTFTTLIPATRLLSLLTGIASITCLTPTHGKEEYQIVADGETRNAAIWQGDSNRVGVIGDNVTVITVGGATGNMEGLYAYGGNDLKAGNHLTLDVSNTDADGIRTNPSNDDNWQNSIANIVVGDYLKVTSRGASGDCLNINGNAKLTVGDNAELYAHGTKKAFPGEGSHAVRVNFNAEITIGKNAYIETTGESSYGLYADKGSIAPDSDKSPVIVLGDNATIVTKNKSSHGIYAKTNATITLEGKASITTEGASSYAVYSFGEGTVINLGNELTIINRNASGTRSLYAYNGTITGTGKYTMTENANIYAYRGIVDITMNNSSAFKGFTNFQTSTSTGQININMQDHSYWALTKSSKLTSLLVDGTSRLDFTISGQTDYTNLLGVSLVELQSGALVTVTLDGYAAQLGDEFKLISIGDSGTYLADGVGFDFSQAVLTEGLDWDTSTFSNDGTIRIVSLDPIPEPSLAWLTIMGIGVVSIRRRKL